MPENNNDTGSYADNATSNCKQNFSHIIPSHKL